MAHSNRPGDRDHEELIPDPTEMEAGSEPLLPRLPQVLFIDSLQKQGYFTVDPAIHHPAVESSSPPEKFRLYYEVHGRGPKRAIFVGGFGMGLVSWEQQIKHFTGANASTNGEEYTLLLFDNRGTGWSDTPSGLYTSQAMAYDTLALLDHLDWRSDVHVVGVSLGGMIIQELARVADLDRFSTFAFLSTTPGRVLFPWSTMYLFLKLAFTQDLEAKFHLANSLLFPSKWLEQPYQSSAVDPDYPPNRVRTNLDFVREGGRIRTPFARLQTFNGFLGQLSACLRHSTSAACLEPLSKHPRIRCLVLTGTDDRMVPPVDSLDLASHLAAPILVFSGSGHVLPLEQASRLNLVLHKHFNGEETASF